MELMQGYERTEIGSIPSDWDVVAIGSVAEFSGGSQPPRSVFKYSEADEYIRLIQIRDYKSDDFLTYIPRHLARKFCSADDIMIGRYGPPIFQILRGIEGAYNVALIKTTPNENILKSYLYLVLKQEKLFNLIEAMSRRTSGQTGVEMPALKGYLFPLPPKHEQHAIAEALADVDALIAGLEKLIAKKRDLKQAVMQQLLTGQTRLPGFSGEWKINFLGDVCRITTGAKDVNEGNPEGQFPFFTCSRSHTFSDVYSFDTEAILIAGNGEVGNLHYFNGKFEAYQRTYVLCDFSAHVGFLWHQLSANLAISLGLGKVGSSIPYIKKSNLAGFQFMCPSERVEQAAIASTLTDMDIELSTLESRLAKSRDLKQGMMQELLTGRTRLI